MGRWHARTGSNRADAGNEKARKTLICGPFVAIRGDAETRWIMKMVPEIGCEIRATEPFAAVRGEFVGWPIDPPNASAGAL